MRKTTYPGLTPKNLFTYAAFFSIFSEALAFQFTPLFEFRISFLIIVLTFFLYLPILENIYMNRYFVFFFLGLAVFTQFNIYLGKNSQFLFLKQFIGISLSSLFFYTLLKICDLDLKKIFSVYLNFAFVVSLIGIIQEVCYWLKLQYLYDFRYIFPEWRLGLSSNVYFLRINSVMPEPTSFCIVLVPAFLAACMAFSRNNPMRINKFKSAVIIVAYFLTFSIIGYLGIFIAIIMALFYSFKKKGAIACLIMMAIISIILCLSFPEVISKLNETFGVIFGKTKIEYANYSTFSLLSNARVTFNVFKNSPLIGNGLGSYAISFDNFISRVIDTSLCPWLFNRNDANSLFLRLLSETGLIGVIVFFLFLALFYLKKNKDPSGYLWIINNGALVSLIMRLVRQGHYFSEGFFFFIWVYYFTKKLAAQQMHENSH